MAELDKRRQALQAAAERARQTTQMGEELAAEAPSPRMQALQAAAERAQGGVSVDPVAVSELEQSFRDGGRGLAQGLTLGGSDEIMGGIGGVLAMAGPDDPGQVAQAVTDRERAANAEAQERSPVPYGVGEAGGATATAVLAAPRTVATTGWGKFGELLGLGATEGAIYGANTADGGDMLESTMRGAGLGVGGALAAPMVTGAVRGAGRMVVDPVSGVVQAMTGKPSMARASRPVVSAMEQSGQSIDDLDAYLKTVQAEGQPEFTVADALGNPGVRTLNGVARSPGPGADLIAETLTRRQAAQSERLSQQVGDALGVDDTADATRQALTAARKDEADVNYPAAREGAKPVDVRGIVAAIDERVAPMQGAGVAMDGADNKLASYRNRLMGEEPLSDFDRVLAVKQDLQDDIGAATRAGRNNEARRLSDVVKLLDNALEQSSDGYRAANDTFAMQSRAIDAVAQGEKAYAPSNRSADVVSSYNAMPDDQQQAFRSGYADRLLGREDNRSTAANGARPLQTPKRREELAAMANDPDLLERQIDREDAMSETFRRTLGGSQTADNLEDMAAVSNNIGIMQNLASGNYGGAVASAAQQASNIAGGMNEDTRLLIARALLSTDPKKDLAPLLREADKDARSARVANALVRQLNLQNNPLYVQ